MKKIFAIIFIAAGFAACKTNETVNAKVESLDTKSDSLSYALGLSIGKNLNDQGFEDVNPDYFTKGMEDAGVETPMIDPLEADMFIRGELKRAQEAKQAAMKKEGEDFLAENGAKDGVITTESGLQYKVVREGTGASPDANDKVTVNYEGTLVDGTIFDSSYKKGEPISFALNGVIRGWTEGLQTMKVGGETMFYIPYDLGYGTRPGPGGTIPGYSTLIFKVELLDVIPQD